MGTGTLTFDLVELYGVGPKIPLSLQIWIFLAFFIGFAIKVPMFPFHTWLPDAHVEAPTAGSVILAGILLKMGTYGFVRFALPLLPQASQVFVPFMVLLSIIGIIYGALVAMAQTDIKKLVAYSSVSHLGFVMLGIFALNEQGVLGGQLQMINHGISTGALFLLVGVVYERRHTRLISDYGGLSKIVPVYTVLFRHHDAEQHRASGAERFRGASSLILIGAFKKSYVYAAFAVHRQSSWERRTCSGSSSGCSSGIWIIPRTRSSPTATRREVLYLMPLIILMFWIGLLPQAVPGEDGGERERKS